MFINLVRQLRVQVDPIITVTLGAAGCFYYILGNIRPIFHSNLRAIQLLAVAKTHDIRTYGSKSLLQPFVEQMNLLARASSSVGG